MKGIARETESNSVGGSRPNGLLTRQLPTVPRPILPASARLLSILILGLVLSACGWPGIIAYSEPQGSGLTEEGEKVEYLVTIELAPGALDEARRGYFSVRGSVSGTGEDVPVIEVSGGDPLAVGGRMDELGLFDFEWDWELPECANGCETTMSLVFEVVEARSDSAGIDWRAHYVIEVPANVESEKEGNLDGVVTVEQIP
jgi:hypothetical protein